MHAGPSASALAAEAGGRACALAGREIFLGEVPSALMPAVLAHEVAHLVQQRLPWDGAPAETAEAEARNACEAALAGHSARLRIAADARVPACWGEAGHYYTVYFCALAAGIRDPVAYRLAFWTQMADEIDELNAVPAGIEMVAEDIISWPSDLLNRAAAAYADLENAIVNQALASVPGGHHFMRPRAIPRRERSDAYFTWLNVQQGLHALTGRECEAETRRRVETTLSYRPFAGQEFEFGLSLHPLGDSFAHRDDAHGRMFAPPVGHGLHGHEPDVLGEHRRALYRRYVATLHEVLTRAAGTTRTAPLSEEATVAALDSIIPVRRALSEDQIRALSRRPGREGADPLLQAIRANARASEPDEERQIAQIRNLALQQTGQRMNAYQPERFDSTAFGDFRAPPSIAVPFALMQRALLLAREWASC